MTDQSAPRPHARRVAFLGAGAVLVVLVALAIGGKWYVARRLAIASGPAAVAPAGSTASGGGMAGMDMSSDGNVHLTADQIRTFGVTFGTVRVRPLATQVRAFGTVIADETKLVQVVPKFGGFVERLYVNATGQPVTAGQRLLTVYSPALVAAEQELLVAGSLERTIGQGVVPGIAGGSPDFVANAKRRLQLWDISDAQIDEVLRSGTVQRALTLYAPASGIVLDKNIVEGQEIQAGQTLYLIANLSEVWVDVALREQDAGDVRAGTRAAVELAAFPGRSIDGRVAYVYPTLDTIARTVRARIEIPNSDGRLKLGMYATVTLTTPVRPALTVQNSAILNTGDSSLVFVDVGGGAFMPHAVALGRAVGDYTEVLSGLTSGQRVVTSAQYLLDSEANLGEVMRSMIGLKGSGADMPGKSLPPANHPNSNESRQRANQAMPGMKMPPPPAPKRR